MFTRSGGVWSQEGDKLVGSGENGAGAFGWSVALSGDGNTAAIGGPNDSSLVGAAWVFTRSAGAWTQQGSKLIGSGETGAGRFGNSVALSSGGDTILTGGVADDASVGAAWVFTRSGASWIPQGSKLGASDELGAGKFGISVALSADSGTALIGGLADNTGAGAAWAFTVATTSVSLSASPNPSTVKQQVTYTATVSPAPGGGTVAFADDGLPVTGCGAVPLSVATGVAACAAPAYLAIGSHAITVSYSGAADFAGSTSPALTQVVNPAVTNTELVSSPSPSVAGEQVTFTATVLPAPDGGTVTFSDGGSPIGGCPALGVSTSTGQVVCHVTYVAAGSHAVVATYTGSTVNYIGSASSTLIQTVTPASGPAPAPPTTPPTPAPTPPTTLTPRSGPAAATLLLACTRIKLGLTSLAVKGPNVRIGVVAGLGFAGRSVSIYRAGSAKVLRSVPVPANGLLSVSVPARARSRYFARIGRVRSSTRPLTRRLAVHPLSLGGGEVRISGVVARPFARPAATVVIRRRTACGSLVTVATVPPAADGRFSVTIPAPAAPHAAVYDAITRVRTSTRATTTAVAPSIAQVVAIG